MATNTDLKLPDWLTEEAVMELKSNLAACPNPYSYEEVCKLGFDGAVDTVRYDAYYAKKVLTLYGLI